jgi:hypothetical protein
MISWMLGNSTSAKGMVEYAFGDSGSFINLPGRLLAFRHRSGTGT